MRESTRVRGISTSSKSRSRPSASSRARSSGCRARVAQACWPAQPATAATSSSPAAPPSPRGPRGPPRRRAVRPRYWALSAATSVVAFGSSRNAARETSKAGSGSSSPRSAASDCSCFTSTPIQGRVAPSASAAANIVSSRGRAHPRWEARTRPGAAARTRPPARRRRRSPAPVATASPTRRASTALPGSATASTRQGLLGWRARRRRARVPRRTTAPRPRLRAARRGRGGASPCPSSSSAAIRRVKPSRW